MEIKVKRWTRLGLGAALASGALAACGNDSSKTPTPETEIVADAASPQPTSTPDPVEVTTGLGGEGEGAGGEGEGAGGEGEGGVSIAAAATDPIVFNAALAITEAHIIAARDAFAEGETEAAAEMFAHPVSEVLFNMEAVFAAQGVDDFTGLLTDASRAVLTGEDATQISARSDTIITALRAASEKAPDNGTSSAAIAAGVAADQIERAADMYRAALESDRYEPYLDGYGFYKAGEAAFLSSASAIEAENASAAEEIRTTLDLLAAAYPTALKPTSLDADPAALIAASSRVKLALGG